MPAQKDCPTIQNDRQYEALREQGMSRQKAARIANSDPQQMASHRQHPGLAYEEWSLEDLYDKARDVGVEGRSSMSKSELINALRKGL